MNPAPTQRSDLASADLEYPLDLGLIATSPAHPRDQARMMVFHRESGQVEHQKVADLPQYLAPGSKMVVNETRVAPLRFLARRISDGREASGLFLSRAQQGRWLAMLKGSKRFRSGDELELIAPHGASDRGGGGDRITLHARRDLHWEVVFHSAEDSLIVLERSGYTPLPPYILQARQRAHSGEPDEGRDRSEYQTVFARASELPSCAAPTAGLHFTDQLLTAIASRGVERVAIELQVGTGTFRPVEAAMLSGHPMHHEQCRVSARNLLALTAWKRDASLVVGTTSVRLLESLPCPIPSQFFETARSMVATGSPDAAAMDFVTNILITPGFDFQWTNRLLTNFHLPRSTLLALVGALVGLDQLKELYAIAAAERYRFYSFGDAMLILP